MGSVSLVHKMFPCPQDMDGFESQRVTLAATLGMGDTLRGLARQGLKAQRVAQLRRERPPREGPRPESIRYAWSTRASEMTASDCSIGTVITAMRCTIRCSGTV